MKRTIYLAITAILLFSLALGGCASQADKSPVPGDYFPIAAGSSWDYAGEGNEFAAFKQEMPYTRDSQAQLYIDNGGTVAAKIVEVTDDAVTQLYFEGEQYDQENLLEKGFNSEAREVLIKTPLQAGTIWKDQGSTREIISLQENVDTPAGTFPDCLKIKITQSDSTAVVYEYYAPGVGLVLREFTDGETKVNSILSSYTITK